MHRKWLIWGAVLAGVSVALGALGAHGLEKETQDEKILHAFQTAVQYQMIHSIALLLTGILYAGFNNRLLKGSAIFFLTGIILFSGSLYLITALKLSGSEGTRIVGPLTPLGGICFLAGWTLLVFAILKKKSSDG